MAVTFPTLDPPQLVGAKKQVTGLMNITANGGAITPASVGMDQIDDFRAEPTGGYVFEYDESAGTITALYGDYSEASDGVLVAPNPAATVSNIPFTAYGY